MSHLVGTPESARVAQHLCPFVGPQEGKGEAGISDFVPLGFLGIPESVGLGANSAIFCTPEKEGVRQLILFLSAPLGTPRTQGLRNISAHLWAPEKARLRSPILISSSLIGDPGGAGLT